MQQPPTYAHARYSVSGRTENAISIAFSARFAGSLSASDVQQTGPFAGADARKDPLALRSSATKKYSRAPSRREEIAARLRRTNVVSAESLRSDAKPRTASAWVAGSANSRSAATKRRRASSSLGLGFERSSSSRPASAQYFSGRSGSEARCRRAAA